jgi:hypothetical protein
VADRERAEEADRSDEEQGRLNRQMTELLNELKRIQAGKPVPTDLVEIIDQINKTLCGFKGDG